MLFLDRFIFGLKEFKFLLFVNFRKKFFLIVRLLG